MATSSEILDEVFESLNQEKLKSKKGEGVSSFRASDIRLSSHVPYGILSRIPELDLALGKPGYPIGRIIELFGLPRCGKTTAALMALAEVQKRGGSGLFIDTEYAFDPERASELGVDVDDLRVSEADTIEEVFRIITRVADSLLDYTKPFAIVVDSITAVPTEWELNENINFESDRPGIQAKSIKKGMRVITPLMSKKNVLLLMINHAYETMKSWGIAATSGGGHGIKFNASARVCFKHIKELKEVQSDKSYIRLGQEIRINIEKVKGAHLTYPEFRIQLLNEGGFNSSASLLNALIRIGIIKQSSPNSKCYWGDLSFQKKDWETILEQKGGEDAVYSYFIENACSLGFMKPYSSQDFK